MDSNFKRFVGYTGCEWTKLLFDPASLRAVQTIVKNKTGSLVSESTIANVVDNLHINYRPTNISPFTRFTQVPLVNPFDDAWQNILLQAAEVIAAQVNADLGLRQESSRLTRWTGTLYGEDVNTHQLRQFAPIKLMQKRPSPFQFHMRY